MSEISGSRRLRARPRRARTALLLLAAGAMTLATAVEGFAQGRGGFAMGGRGFAVGGAGQRFPGGDGPRNPGRNGPTYPGNGPRFPGGHGGVILPGAYGPGGPVVVLDDDPMPRRTRKAAKKQKPKPKQQVAQPRGGFDVPASNERRFVPDEVLLSLSASLSGQAFDAFARRNRLTRLEQQDFALTRRRLARLRINDGRPVATVIRALQADARVLGAQPNYLYGLQQSKSESSEEMQYSLSKLHLPQAHALAKGDNVLVAVVDTMIDADHPDLAGAVAAKFDATGAPDKPHSHGTGIAGVIAAHGRLTGAAPAVKILAVHAFSSANSNGTSMNVLKGLDWAANARANVINMSFAGAADPEVRTMTEALRAKGIVLVAAAGNAGPKSRPLYPAAYPEVIAVTATDIDDNLFDRANRGTHIAVAAPGVAILAPAPDGGYQLQSGTSFAAAQVSGIVALVLDRNRKLDGAAVRRILTSTAHDLGAPGHDDQFGAGLADAFAAVTSASPTSNDVSGSAVPAH